MHKNSGTLKWMAKIMENPIKMDDLGVPLFFGNTQVVVSNWNPGHDLARWISKMHAVFGHVWRCLDS